MRSLKPMSKTKLFVGIDFGSTQTSVAFMTPETQQIHFLKSTARNRLTFPTAVAFPTSYSDPLFGEDAYQKLLHDPGCGASFFKRRIGDAQWYIQIEKKHITAEELSRLYLQDLRLQLQKEIGLQDRSSKEPRLETVVTVPAYFDDTARKKTMQAALDAGWPHVRLINEPSASALAYQSLHPEKIRDGQFYMIFDLGGGTLDVSIFTQHEHQISIITSVGDTELGGRDWDDALLLDAAYHFQKKNSWDPIEDPFLYTQMQDRIRTCKEELTTHSTSNCILTHNQTAWKHTWNRDDLRELTGGLLERSLQVVEQSITQAQLKTSDIASMFFVGGGSQIPSLQEYIQHKTQISGYTILKPLLSTAMGACIYAQKSTSHAVPTPTQLFLPGRCLQDVVPHPLGVLTLRDGKLYNQILFKGQSSRSIRKTLHRCLPTNNTQGVMQLYITQTDNPYPKPSQIVELWEIDLDSQKDEIDITIEYTLNGLIQLSARDSKHQKKLKTRQKKDRIIEDILKTSACDILLVMDCSASMKGRSILESKLAANTFVQMFEKSSTRLGLISFGDPDVRLRVHFKQDPLFFKSHLAELQAQGTTPMSKALHLAHQLFEEPRQDIPERQQVLILITDGHPDNPQRTVEYAQMLQQMGVRIMSIGIGKEIQEEFLTHSICTHHTDYKNAKDPSELSDVFIHLASEINMLHTVIPRKLGTHMSEYDAIPNEPNIEN